jgi:hypothetical protein
MAEYALAGVLHFAKSFDRAVVDRGTGAFEQRAYRPLLVEGKTARAAARASPSRLGNFRRLIEKCRFAQDSPLEGTGFEPSVPAEEEAVSKTIPAYMGIWRVAPRELRRLPAISGAALT